MIEIRYVDLKDEEFWYSLDKHLRNQDFNNLVRDNRGFIIFKKDIPIGLLRYNLFWDNIPFCNLIFINNDYQRKGYGKMLLEYWEKDMKTKGYDIVLTSTQVNETAQFFYRKLGYKDCGGLVIDILGYEQPMELFLIKSIK